MLLLAVAMYVVVVVLVVVVTFFCRFFLVFVHVFCVLPPSFFKSPPQPPTPVFAKFCFSERQTLFHFVLISKRSKPAATTRELAV